MNRRDFISGAGIGAMLWGVAAHARAIARQSWDPSCKANNDPWVTISNRAGVMRLSVAEFQRQLNLASGGTLFLESGEYVLKADELSATGIQIPARTTISGAGANFCCIRVEGESACNVFRISDVSSVTIEKICLIGNSRSGGYGHGAAILIWCNSHAESDLEDVAITDCRFENFRAEFWIWILNRESERQIRNLKITGCHFESHPNNAKGPEALNSPSYCIGIQGASDKRFGGVHSALIERNTVLASHIKGFVVVWHGCKQIDIVRNLVIGAGATIRNNCGAYGIAVYNNARLRGRAPDQVAIFDNEIVAPRSCGIYVVEVGGIRIKGNKVSRQYDEIDQTLPKGAIVVNCAVDAIIEENEVTECYGGIVLLGNDQSESLRAIRNVVSGIASARGFGVLLGTSYRGLSGMYEVVGNVIRSANGTGIGIKLNFDERRRYRRLAIAGNVIDVGRGRCIVPTHQGRAEAQSEDTQIQRDAFC